MDMTLGRGFGVGLDELCSENTLPIGTAGLDTQGLI
jgi:hypothetical protein